MKKQLKDVLQYYIGTGLKIDLERRVYPRGIKLTVLSEKNLNDIKYCAKIYGAKPHLRPLSSLTKEITVEGYNNGEPFVPALEIAKLCDSGHNYTDSAVIKYNKLVVIKTDKCDDVQNIAIKYNENTISSISRLGDNVYYETYSKINELLLKWQFNVFDIPESQYIEIKD